MKFSTAIILLLLAMQMFSFSFGMEWGEESPKPRPKRKRSSDSSSSIMSTVGTTWKLIKPVVGFAAKTVRKVLKEKLGSKRADEIEHLVEKGQRGREDLIRGRNAEKKKDVLFLSFDHAFTFYTSLTFGISLYLFFPFSLRHLKILLMSMASIYLYMKYYTYGTSDVEFFLIKNDMWCVVVPLVFAAVALFLCVTMKLLNFIIIFGAPSLVAILVTVKGCTTWLDGDSGYKVEPRHVSGGQLVARSDQPDPDAYKPVGDVAVEK